ncbi:MAG: hypothetical protein H6710_04835 [Myxococcales bacterium]|nr:hypothetical protein [Myxococcales bacterium]MCB9705620.1 hypothetical protein [Myxococcales bacterium]
MKLDGKLMATSVASLFLSACGPKADHSDVVCPDLPQSRSSGVRCLGINTCRGTSECLTKGPGGKVDHHCGGQNTCAGKGWLTVEDAETCGERGGKVF